VYQNIFVQALSRLAALKAEDRKFDEAISCYRRAIEVEPFQEELHRGMMQALSDAGRKKEALQHFEGLEKLLREEMDLPPAEETIALQAQIQKQAKAAG
jgi:DNA-binding SARP family transcriptional activator